MPLKTASAYRQNPYGPLSKKQVKSVKAITKKVLRSTMETKTVGRNKENIELFHNKAFYQGGLLSTDQGIVDPNNQQSLKARIGDEILLRNTNVRLWLSNKNDRPNVMYKCILFWYESGAQLSDAYCYFTQTNKMLDRLNVENIGIIDQKTIFSQSSYSTGVASDAGSAKEHSQLCTLNGNWKGKKIKYVEGAPAPADKDIGVCVVCYDAYGTLQTDNIASFAFNYVTRFQDP
ncbi:MAG: putative capsid protein [Circoviridae sp.]|nr:MAG: putative capsid protein [Circoviridae sp.]